MVIDRTIEDVISAKKIIEEKVKNFLELSAEDLEVLERGTFSVSTINRIEEKQKELYDFFTSSLYLGGDVNTRNWEENQEIFKQADMERIVKNNETLRDMFFVYSSTPKEANASYTYENLNNIERLLFDLDRMYNFMWDNLKECDTFYCGEE